jgi:hypothetical protein
MQIFKKFLFLLNTREKKTASLLLKKFKLIIPLEKLLKNKDDIFNNLKKNINLQMKERFKINKGKKYMIGGNIKKDIYNDFVKLDFLHDFFNSQVNKEWRTDICATILNDINIDDVQKKSFLNNFINSKNITTEFVDYLVKKNKLNDSLISANYKIKNNNLNLESDEQLYNIWLSWVSTKEEKINIVIDGLFLNYDNIPIIDKKYSNFCAGLIETAFILLLFQNGGKIMEKINNTLYLEIEAHHKNIQLNEICLFDGIFNDIDSSPAIYFYKKYCESLKSTHTNIKKVTLSMIGIDKQPIYFHKYYKNNIIINNINKIINIIINNDNKTQFVFTSNVSSSIDLTDYNICNKLKKNNHIHLFYTKKQLSKIIHNFCSVYKKNFIYKNCKFLKKIIIYRITYM